MDMIGVKQAEEALARSLGRQAAPPLELHEPLLHVAVSHDAPVSLQQSR